jgi:hypothetical protein
MAAQITKSGPRNNEVKISPSACSRSGGDLPLDRFDLADERLERSDQAEHELPTL